MQTLHVRFSAALYCSLPPHESLGSHVSEWISIVRYPILASCSIDYCMFFFWYIHCTKGDSCSIMAPLISLEHWHHTHIHTHCQCRPRPILIIIKLCLCLSALPTRALPQRRGERRKRNQAKQRAHAAARDDATRAAAEQSKSQR